MPETASSEGPAMRSVHSVASSFIRDLQADFKSTIHTALRHTIAFHYDLLYNFGAQ